MATKKIIKRTAGAQLANGNSEVRVSTRGLTENVTGVFRMPVTVKKAIEAEATAEGVTPAAIVRQALARELERRKYTLAPETRAVCGL